MKTAEEILKPHQHYMKLFDVPDYLANMVTVKDAVACMKAYHAQFAPVEEGQGEQMVVLKFEDGGFCVWSKAEYEKYLSDCVQEGAGSCYHLIHEFRLSSPAPNTTGRNKDFLSVLEENYAVAKRVTDNEIDKMFPTANKRDAVLEVYEDLISIYKHNAASKPAEGQEQMWNRVISVIAAGQLFDIVAPDDVKGLNDWKSRKMAELKAKYTLIPKQQ